MKFFLGRLPWDDTVEWFRKEDGSYRSCINSFYYNVIIIEEVEAESFKDLPFEKTSYYRPNSPHGALDRHGKFHPCSYAGHGPMAVHLFGKRSWAELNSEGWIHVYGDENRRHHVCFKEWWEGEKFPTRSQIDWLIEHGYEVEDKYLPKIEVRLPAAAAYTTGLRKLGRNQFYAREGD